MSGAIPRTSNDVTAEFLTTALRQSGTIGPDTIVTAMTADPAGAGIGFIGEVAAFDLTYDGDATGAPSRVVAKFPTASPEIRAMMRPTRIYEREHRFYDELASETPIRTPEIYHITCETSSDEAVEEEYLLLMEDLGGLTIGDQLAGVSVDQAASALTGLAEHHARFWGGSGLEAVDFVPVINGELNQSGVPIYAGSLPGFLEVFAHALHPEMVPHAEAYGESFLSLLDKLAAMPRTLVHFDYRADNLFFDADGSVVVIDWQSISQGGGAADVGYFLSQNLSVEDRREHEDALLHTYHDRLVASGVADYPFEQFFEDYRVGVMYGWIIPVFAVGSLDVSSERAMALWTEVLARVQAAIFDHNAHEHIN
ncbi:MAG: phosphotransferase [Acidimicrobiales bacterium]